MDLFFNESSLHGQFPDIPTFVDALDALMAMRKMAKKYNRELYCHRSCQQAAVTHQLTLYQAIQRIDKNKARVLMAWFGRTGPYWEDVRQHSDDEYIECQGQVVTDTAIGECAYLKFSNKSAQLASMAPSSWTSASLPIIWHRNDDESLSETLINHVSVGTLDAVLLSAAPPLQSWDQLMEVCRQRFDNLYFLDEAFKPLKGTAFVLGAAKSLLDLLDVLSKFKSAHHPATGRSQDGHELYQTFFTGQLAWFTDSSTQEKSDFQYEMTFPHPEKSGETLFAPFHGKVQTPQMRIHFSWPVTSEAPLYVVYVGDKITKY
jgi:hypothetical protein